MKYEQIGKDTDEFMEIAVPCNIPVSELYVHLYNGKNGKNYRTYSVSTDFTKTASIGEFDIYFIELKKKMQNGGKDGDGIAVVRADGVSVTVFEFLSYEGTITASNGPASGMSSFDVGVELKKSPLTTSLVRTGSYPVSDFWKVGTATATSIDPGLVLPC
eukprot:scaffold5773_cov322-Prasinococcus_capsulatus_cf.AAC.4